PRRRRRHCGPGAGAGPAGRDRRGLPHRGHRALHRADARRLAGPAAGAVKGAAHPVAARRTPRGAPAALQRSPGGDGPVRGPAGRIPPARRMVGVGSRMTSLFFDVAVSGICAPVRECTTEPPEHIPHCAQEAQMKRIAAPTAAALALISAADTGPDPEQEEAAPEEAPVAEEAAGEEESGPATVGLDEVFDADGFEVKMVDLRREVDPDGFNGLTGEEGELPYAAWKVEITNNTGAPLHTGSTTSACFVGEIGR